MDFTNEKKAAEEAIRKWSNKTSSDVTQLTQLEIRDYDVEAKKANILSAYQDIKERKRYAFWIFLMVLAWLIAIVAIIILCGTGYLKISDPVQLGLIGATTINVTTFFVIVTKYLFPSGSLSK